MLCVCVLVCESHECVVCAAGQCSSDGEMFFVYLCTNFLTHMLQFGFVDVGAATFSYSSLSSVLCV